MYKKEELRKIIEGYRRAMAKDDVVMKSIAIIHKVLNLKEYQKADCIYCYVDFHNEVKTKPLIHQAFLDGKRVAAPKVLKDGMEFYYIKGYEDLQPGYSGIYEPVNCPMAMETNALILMPGVAFDKRNHRIGFGKGFYDRYLQRENTHYKIALAYDFQVFDKIPQDSYDICPDLVVTESKMYRKENETDIIINEREVL